MHYGKVVAVIVMKGSRCIHFFAFVEGITTESQLMDGGPFRMTMQHYGKNAQTTMN